MNFHGFKRKLQHLHEIYVTQSSEINLFRVQDRAKWNMSNHFLVSTLIPLCQLNDPIQDENFPISGRLTLKITLEVANAITKLGYLSC